MIKEKYNNAEFKLPKIIFWNLQGKIIDFPSDDIFADTMLISGFNTDILKYIFTNKEFNSFSYLQNIINSDRYKPIKNRIDNFTEWLLL